GIAEKNTQVGQVNGLAWTEVGGELLTIEAIAVPGKGKNLTTGKLGDGTAATSRNRPQEQDALDPETGIWAVQLVQRAAELIAGAVMQTRHRPGETCRLPEICPLCPQGRQITQD
ncbi:MAG: S16 family serine protease, partial [Rothia dentocariosa]